MNRIITLLFFCLCLFQAPTANALSLLGILDLYSDAQSGMSGEAICKKHNISGCPSYISAPEAICRAGHGSGCTSYMQTPEAICRAGHGSGCTSYMQMPEAICRAGHGSGCTSYMQLPEAICRAGHGSGCTSYMQMGEAICRAGGGTSCYSYTSVEDALRQYRDHEWDWDGFYHQGQHVYVCRGVQTGQFAEYEHCAGKSQNDDRWPGPDYLP